MKLSAQSQKQHLLPVLITGIFCIGFVQVVILRWALRPPVRPVVCFEKQTVRLAANILERRSSFLTVGNCDRHPDVYVGGLCVGK